MRHLVGALLGLVAGPAALSAQDPLPPPKIWNAQIAFFKALPKRFPASDISAFEKLVADDVQVYRDGKLVHRTRQSWISELQHFEKGKGPGNPQGYSASRDSFHKLADGGILVREFYYPIAPDGAHIVYHPSNPLRNVTYYLDEGRLVRVVYGPAMTSYGELCFAAADARQKPADRARFCDLPLGF